jgi:hypothetical protein
VLHGTETRHISHIASLLLAFVPIGILGVKGAGCLVDNSGHLITQNSQIDQN